MMHMQDMRKPISRLRHMFMGCPGPKYPRSTGKKERTDGIRKSRGEGEGGRAGGRVSGGPAEDSEPGADRRKSKGDWPSVLTLSSLFATFQG